MVSSQYINQTPMGVKDGPPVTTLRIEALEAALRLHEYPREVWAWFVAGALMFHGLVTENDQVYWPDELGKRRQFVTYADVLPEWAA